MELWRGWRAVPPLLVLVVLGLASVIWASRVVDSAWGTAVAGGLLAGVLFSTARMVYRPVPKLAAAVLASSLIVLAAQWLMHPAKIIPVVLIAVAFCLVWYAVWDVWITRSVNTEIRSDITVRGGSGTSGRILIVYHPGKHGFQKKLQTALGDGLMSLGWRVEMTTASAAAPADLGPYDLVVLGTPVYNWLAAEPLRAYIKRCSGLRGRRVALVLSGGGATGMAMSELRRHVAAAGGEIVEALELWTERPNQPRHGLSDPEEIMKRAAERLNAAIGGPLQFTAL